MCVADKWGLHICGIAKTETKQQAKKAMRSKHKTKNPKRSMRPKPLSMHKCFDVGLISCRFTCACLSHLRLRAPSGAGRVDKRVANWSMWKIRSWGLFVGERPSESAVLCGN